MQAIIELSRLNSMADTAGNRLWEPVSLCVGHEGEFASRGLLSNSHAAGENETNVRRATLLLHQRRSGAELIPSLLCCLSGSLQPLPVMQRV